MDDDFPPPPRRARRIPIIGTIGDGDVVTMEEGLGYVEVPEDEIDHALAARRLQGDGG